MKIIYSKPKKSRILKCQSALHNSPTGIFKTKRPLWIKPIENGWWFDITDKKWSKEYNSNHENSSSYYAIKEHGNGFHDVYSLKSAIRLIKKWNLKGVTFKVSLPFIGHYFLITT